MTASDAKETPVLRGKFHVSQPGIADKSAMPPQIEAAVFCDEKQKQAKANLAKAEHNLQRMAAGNAALQQHINVNKNLIVIGLLTVFGKRAA